MKKIFITGVSRGIGNSTALKLLEDGYEVIGTSTSGDADIDHENFECVRLDLSDSNSIDSLLKELELQNTQLDAIINNAAILVEEWGAPDDSIDVGVLKHTLDVNFFGTIQLTEGLIPFLNEDSKIINISSNWGSFSDEAFDAYHPHYKMSKAALNMYSKLLGARFENHDISIITLDPGWVRTDMGTMDAHTSPEEIADQIVDMLEEDIPSGQFWRNGQVRDW